DEKSFDYDIFMNHVLDHKGYRFFQSSFHPDEKGTGLSVNHDFWGTWITYIGYTLLYIGLIGTMFFGQTRFKELNKMLKKVKARKAALTTLLLLLGTGFAQGQQTDHGHMEAPTRAQVDSVIRATTVDRDHAEKFGALIVQDHGGRMKPIHTFASELLRKLSGSDRYGELTANQAFLSMMLNPGAWYSVDFIALGKKENDSLRHLIGVPEGTEYVKAVDFFDDKGMYKLRPFLEKATAKANPSNFEKDLSKVGERLSLLNVALSGQIVKIFPLLNDSNNKRSEEHTSELQSRENLVCRLLLEKKKKKNNQ